MTLAKLGNIATLIVCSLVVAHLAYTDRQLFLKSPVLVGSYEKGKKISDSPALGLGTSRQTLILATSSVCHFCTSSMPFYRRLIPTAKASGTRVVGLAVDELTANRDYLLQNGLQVDSLVSGKEQRMNISATPTLILVKNDGTVINSWVGQLSTADERKVESAVRNP
jgi:hypothetical protein